MEAFSLHEAMNVGGADQSHCIGRGWPEDEGNIAAEQEVDQVLCSGGDRPKPDIAILGRVKLTLTTVHVPLVRTIIRSHDWRGVSPGTRAGTCSARRLTLITRAGTCVGKLDIFASGCVDAFHAANSCHVVPSALITDEAVEMGTI
jgi:hypothetical protein